MQKIILPLSAFLALAACADSGYVRGSTDTERAIVGAAAGCVAGEIIEDGQCVTGAAIGAAGGALANDI